MHYVIHCAKDCYVYNNITYVCMLHISAHVYLWHSSEMVSYLLYPLTGCMHLFASVGQIRWRPKKQSLCGGIQYWMAPKMLARKKTRIIKKQLTCHNKQLTKRMSGQEKTFTKSKGVKNQLESLKSKKEKTKTSWVISQTKKTK